MGTFEIKVEIKIIQYVRILNLYHYTSSLHDILNTELYHNTMISSYECPIIS